MLDRLETIGAFICGFLVLATASMYALVKLPSTTSLAFIPEVEELNPAPEPPSSPPTPQPLSAADQAIVAKLSEQGVKVPAGQPVLTRGKKVAPELLEYIDAEANWLPQLNLAKSNPVKTKNGDTRLKIFDIQPNSLFQKFGFQEGDVIELIDGEILEFRSDMKSAYYKIFKSKMEKLRNGEAFSVTITRNNRPLNLEFRL